MKVPAFLARQLAHPSGLFGRFVMGALLDGANRRHNQLVLEALDLSPTDRVLEVGFGGGGMLAMLLKSVPEGQVAGLDPSDAMYKRATSRLRAPVASGKLQLKRGGVDDLARSDDSFDAVCSVNTIYFWPSLERGLGELSRVLRPGGRLVLGYGDADQMRKAGLAERGFVTYQTNELKTALSNQGFAPGNVTSTKAGPHTALALSATRIGYE